MRAMPSTKMKLNPAIELGKQTTDGQGEHEAIPKSPSLKAFKKLPTWSNEKWEVSIQNPKEGKY